MQNIHLRENRQHGGLLMPIDCYEMLNQNCYDMLECHWHEEMELFKIMKGTMRVQAGEEIFEAHAGDLLFFNSEELHAATALEGEISDYRAIVFSPDILCGSDGDCVRLDYIVPVLNGGLVLPRMIHDNCARGIEIHQSFDILYHLVEKQPELFPFLLKSEIFHLFALLLADAKRMPATIRRNEAVSGVKGAISYIQENYAKPITLKELSDLCSMSQGHFCRVFKQYTTKTPVQYINTVRLSKAMELLRETDRKVLDIALDTGFNSLSYFIGVFRESVGTTPTAYRQQEESSHKIL